MSLSYCPTGGCDVSVKVVQNNIESIYMLPQSVDKTKLPTDAASFTTSAINLNASAGVVTKIELLDTPNAQINGLPTNPTVLFTYGSTTLDVQDENLSTFEVYFNKENSNLKISGLKEGKYSAIIYNLLGEKLMETSFNANEINEITLPKLTEQVYIINLNDGYNSFSKKIILK